MLVDFLGPQHQQVVAGVHLVGVGGLFRLDGGLKAVAAKLAAVHADLLGACGKVCLGHIEELENVVVARAVYMVGISTGFGNNIAAVRLRGECFELLKDLILLSVTVSGVALVDFEADALGRVVVAGIVKFQLCALVGCKRIGHQHREDHCERQQTAQRSLHCFLHSWLLLLRIRSFVSLISAASFCTKKHNLPC